MKELDGTFPALADPRLAMVERLVRSPASVSQLATLPPMSRPARVPHLGMLESAGIVSTEKVGRVRTYRLEPLAPRRAEAWLADQCPSWEHRPDLLELEPSKPSD